MRKFHRRRGIFRRERLATRCDWDQQDRRPVAEL